MAVTTLDPITFEVMRSAFEYTCERMSTVLQRASFSPIIYDMVDYSNAIFDPDTQLLGQTANCPVHLAAMHFSARASIKKYADTLGPGDVVVLNDPYEGGTHTCDVCLVKPETRGYEAWNDAPYRIEVSDLRLRPWASGDPQPCV